MHRETRQSPERHANLFFLFSTSFFLASRFHLDAYYALYLFSTLCDSSLWAFEIPRQDSDLFLIIFVFQSKFSRFLGNLDFEL